MNIQKRKSVSSKFDPKTASFLFTSSARVRHTRQLPSIDERSLIANPLSKYKQPTYILEQAVHLANDVEALRKELAPLRLQFESLRSAIDYTDTTQENVDPLEEISRRDGYSKLHRLQDDSRELDSQMTLLNTTFVDQSKNDLNAYVTEQYHMRAQTEVDISDLREAIEIQTKELDNTVDRKIRDKYLENEKKIKELKETLSELKDEEKQLLKQHKQAVIRTTHDPKKEELLQTQSTLLKQLKTLQHRSSQKRVELAKIQKIQESQKKDLEDVIQEQKNRINQEKSTEMYIRNYQRRVSSVAEDSEKEKEYLQSLVDFYREDNQETELVKRIVKRRHKRFHPASKDGDNNNDTNENNCKGINENNNECQIQDNKNDNEEIKNNNESQVNEDSAVSPHESEAHISSIEPVEANNASFVTINEEEEINSHEPNDDNEIGNKMSEEKVNDILMDNLKNLDVDINT